MVFHGFFNSCLFERKSLLLRSLFINHFTPLLQCFCKLFGKKIFPAFFPSPREVFQLLSILDLNKYVLNFTKLTHEDSEVKLHSRPSA